MKKFLTSVVAIDNVQGKLGKWVGPIIEAESRDEAEEWCKRNAPYIFIDKEILTVSEEDVKRNLYFTKN
jgi:hypothetical protein